MQVAGTEGCDDGNTINGDGCSRDCSVEPGWSCFHYDVPPYSCGEYADVCAEVGCGFHVPLTRRHALSALISHRHAQSALLSHHALRAQICGDSLTVGRERLDGFCEDGNTVTQSTCALFDLPSVLEDMAFEIKSEPALVNAGTWRWLQSSVRGGMRLQLPTNDVLHKLVPPHQRPPHQQLCRCCLNQS